MPFLAAIALIGAGCSESESTNDAATNAEPFACTPAPEDLDRVDLTPPWSDVTERQLELRLRREDSRRDTPDGFSRTPVDLTIEQLDGELSFRWASRTTLFDGLDISATEERLLEPLIERAPRQVLEYRLDADRLWIGPDNPDELRENIDDTYDLLVGLGAFDETLVAEVRQFYAEMPDEQLALTFAQEPQIFHSFEGLELLVDERFEFPDLVPNAFGGEPFPATTSIWVDELIDEDGCVRVELQTTPDPESFTRILFETLRDAFGNEPDQAEADELGETFRIETTVVAQFDQGTGFFRSVSTTRFVTDGQEERVDTRSVLDVTQDE